MKLKHGKFIVPEGNPYENDLLNRSEFGTTLSTVISKITGSLTISINGPWGTGKTVFLKMWNQSLNDAGFSTIYFSAWEDDHSEDALIALMGQIWSSIKDNDWKEMGKTLKEAALPFLKNAGLQVLKKGTSLVTGGVIELDEETLKSNAEKMLEEYSKTTENLHAVKKRLAETSEQCRKKTGKPLVVIIDELDRCRPLFAIELLEKIKHFFEIPGIIFVLGIDREQLGHSVRSVYGDRMNVDGYLRRFIDLEFLLKTDDPKPFFQGVFEKYADTIEDSSTTETAITYNADLASIVSKCFNLSLREMEYLARTLVIGTVVNPEVAGSVVLPVLVALKLRDEEFYKRIIGEVGCYATEIIDRLVTVHNAWELFAIDPQTKKATLEATYGYNLCIGLYAISSYEWRRGVREFLEEQVRNINHGKELQWPKNLFHHVVMELFNVDQRPEYICVRSEFRRNILHGPSIHDLSKCIELIEYKDKTKGR